MMQMGNKISIVQDPYSGAISMTTHVTDLLKFTQHIFIYTLAT